MLKKYTKLLACAALCVLLFIGCTKRTGGYESVVPRDATLVVRAELAKVTGDLRLGESGVMDMLKGTLAPVLRQSMQEQLDLLIDDPSLSGLDFDSPIYLFRLRGNMQGLVVRVGDESLLEKLLDVMAGQGICSKTTKHDGYSWCSVLDDMEVVWSDDALLLMLNGEATSRTQLQQTMLALMSQESEEAFALTDNYKKMLDMDGEISLYTNLYTLPEEWLDGIAAMIPNGVRTTEIELVAGVTINQKAIDINTQFFSNSENAQKLIDDYFAMLCPAGNHFRGYIPADGCKAWIAAGVVGPELLAAVKRIPALKEMLIAANLGIDLDTMIRTMQGDLLFVLTNRGYTLYSQISDKQFMNDVDYWMQSAKDYGIRLEALGGQNYRLCGEGIEAYWGLTDDDDLYMSTMPDVQKRPAVNSVELALDGEYNLLAEINLEDVPMFHSLVIRSEKPGEFKLSLQMKSMLEELAKQLPRQWKQH